MRIKIITLICVLWMPLLVNANQSTNGKWLKNQSQYFLNKGDYPKAIHYGIMLRQLGESNHNATYQLYAYIYLGQALMMNGRQQPAKYYMNKSLQLALALHNNSALCSVYNGLGLYASNVERNYYRSIDYYFKGINTAKHCGNTHLAAILLGNLCNVYYWKQDPEGLKYALECYALGHKQRDAYAIFIGANSAAYMYYLNHNYTSAIRYIQEAEAVMHKNDFYDQSLVYNLLGKILAGMGKNDKAISEFKKSISFSKTASASSIADAYLGYAHVLMKQNKYAAAVPLLYEGVKVLDKYSNVIHRYDLYEAMSQCFEHLGKYEQSLQFFKASQTEKDSLFNAEKETALNEILIKYDIERQKNEVKQTKLEILQNEKQLQITMMGFFIVLIILVGVFYLYRRRNKLYLQIVRLNKDALAREKMLEEEMKQLQRDTDKLDTKYAASSLTNQKSEALFIKLNRMMRENRIYTDSLLTKEKLAEYLGTNRTYLSRVINEQTEQPFTKYVNKFRIEEAIRLLSDPQNETPLKAICAELGFKSLSTFYTLFQSTTGMTPSQYRSRAKET